MGDASVTNVKINIIDRTELMADKYIIQDGTITLINNDSAEMFTTTWTAIGGEHEIIVEIDPDNYWPEVNKTNNEASKNITVKYPPFLSLIPDIELKEDTPMDKQVPILLNQKITDEDTEIKDMDIKVKSSTINCAVFRDQATNNLKFSLAHDWYGTAIITVTISDGGASVNRSFKVIVTPIDDAPRFNETNFTLIATEDVEFTCQIKAYEPDHESLAFFDNTPLFDIDQVTGEIQFTPTQEEVNNSPYIINITISDGKLNTNKSFELIIKNVNDPPHISPITDQYAKVGEPFELQVIATDVDSEELFYYVDPDKFMIGRTTGLIKFTPESTDADNTYIIKVIVSDSEYSSSNLTFKLIVNASDETNNNGNGHPKNDTPTDGKTEQWTVAGIPGIYLISIIMIILIIVVIVIIASIMKKRKQKPDSGQYFDNGYEKDGLSHHEQEEGTYEEEYRKLYSKEPPAQRPEKKKHIKIKKTESKLKTSKNIKIKK